MQWLYLFIAIIAEVIATSSLKASEGFTRLVPTLLVATGYGVAFFFLSLIVKTFPVGVAYAIWSGAGIILIAAIGYFYYKQTLDLPAIVGIILILAGVLVINLFSKSIAH